MSHEPFFRIIYISTFLILSLSANSTFKTPTLRVDTFSESFWPLKFDLPKFFLKRKLFIFHRDVSLICASRRSLMLSSGEIFLHCFDWSSALLSEKRLKTIISHHSGVLSGFLQFFFLLQFSKESILKKGGKWILRIYTLLLVCTELL